MLVCHMTLWLSETNNDGSTPRQQVLTFANICLGSWVKQFMNYTDTDHVAKLCGYLDIIWHICFFNCIPFVKGQKVHNRKKWKYTTKCKRCHFPFFGGQKNKNIKTRKNGFIPIHKLACWELSIDTAIFTWQSHNPIREAPFWDMLFP